MDAKEVATKYLREIAELPYPRKPEEAEPTAVALLLQVEPLLQAEEQERIREALPNAIQAALSTHMEAERGVSEAVDAGCDLSELPSPLDLAIKAASESLGLNHP